jgi:hypothetical protein
MSRAFWRFLAASGAKVSMGRRWRRRSSKVLNVFEGSSEHAWRPCKQGAADLKASPLPPAPLEVKWLRRSEDKRLRSCCHFGLSWGHLVSSWAVSGPSWGHVGAILGHLVLILAILGLSWGHLGVNLGHLGLIFGLSWAILGSLGHLGVPSW